MSGYHVDHLAKQRGFTETEEEIRKLVGYHNYYRMGVYRAVALIQQDCPEGWGAGYQGYGNVPPEGALSVGQVRVHDGGGDFPLYVYPDPGNSRREFNLSGLNDRYDSTDDLG